MAPETFGRATARLPDFVRAGRALDPGGKFRNAFVDAYVFDEMMVRRRILLLFAPGCLPARRGSVRQFECSL